MVDPVFGANAPPPSIPHLVEEPDTLLIKIATNFMPDQETYALVISCPTPHPRASPHSRWGFDIASRPHPSGN